MKRKILSALLCGFVLLGTFCGCNKDTKTDIDEAVNEAGIVMVIGDYKVDRDFYEFYFKTFKDSYASLGSEASVDISDPDEYTRAVRELCLNYFKNNAAVYNHAKSLGIDVDNIDPEKIAQNKAQVEQLYGSLDAYGEMIDRVMERYVYEDAIREKLMEGVSDKELKEYLESEYCTASHILIRADLSDGQPLSAKGLMESHSAAIFNICKMAKEGKSFEEACGEYPNLITEQVLENHGELFREYYAKAAELEAFTKPVSDEDKEEGGKLTATAEFTSLVEEFANKYIDEESEIIYARATEVYEKAAAGEDFDELIKQYGEDPGMENSPEGYTFTKGKMVDEFYNAAMALDVGEISHPVRSSYGFHIIKRLPLNLTDEHISENRLSYAWEYVSNNGIADEAYEKQDELLNNTEVICTSLYEQITVEDFMDDTEVETKPEETQDAGDTQEAPAEETKQAA